MEATTSKHRPHIKVGKDADEEDYKKICNPETKNWLQASDEKPCTHNLLYAACIGINFTILCWRSFLIISFVPSGGRHA